jgi:hypothetical protein
MEIRLSFSYTDENVIFKIVPLKMLNVITDIVVIRLM